MEMINIIYGVVFGSLADYLTHGHEFRCSTPQSDSPPKHCTAHLLARRGASPAPPNMKLRSHELNSNTQFNQARQLLM
eukprot:16426857-Heterocapsa_arctica.AAC.1